MAAACRHYPIWSECEKDLNSPIFDDWRPEKIEAARAKAVQDAITADKANHTTMEELNLKPQPTLTTSKSREKGWWRPY